VAIRRISFDCETVRKSPVGAGLPAMDVNDNAGCLNKRVAPTFFAGKPAPTGECVRTKRQAASAAVAVVAPATTPRYQNTDQPIRWLSSSSAAIPASELPAALSSGDQTHTVNCPGTTATIPPPTPLLPGKPTR